MGIFEIGVVITTMLCMLLAMVPFGYGVYRFHYRVKIRGMKQVKALFPQIQARWPGLVGTPQHFVITIGDTQVRFHATYSPASQTFGTFARTGDMSIAIEADVAGQGCPFTIRHEQARPTSRDLRAVASPAELPEHFLMESSDPQRAATLWTPTTQAAAAHVRGGRVTSDGKTIWRSSSRVPQSLDEIEAIIDLVVAFATA